MLQTPCVDPTGRVLLKGPRKRFAACPCEVPGRRPSWQDTYGGGEEEEGMEKYGNYPTPMQDRSCFWIGSFSIYSRRVLQLLHLQKYSENPIDLCFDQKGPYMPYYWIVADTPKRSPSGSRYRFFTRQRPHAAS